MVCGDCVQQLAFKLVRNHSKLDLIRALELAEKGVERVEQRKIKAGIAGKDDYTQDCLGSTPNHPELCGTQSCEIWLSRFCRNTSVCSGTCVCPDPLEHSHLVRDSCSCSNCCGDYPLGSCPEGCSCHCVNDCGYDCDEGYTWNGSACIEAAVGQPYISRVQRVAGMRTWGGNG